MNQALRALWPWSLASLAVAGTCYLTGCPSTVTTTTYIPITGIEIDSERLAGIHGCGEGPDQVYKYIAVLAYLDAPNEPYTSTVVSCDSIGVLSNLPPYSDANSDASTEYDFTIQIYAYNKDSFPAALDCTPSLAGGGPGDNTCNTVTPCWSWNDAGHATLVAGGTMGGDGGVAPLYPPNWTTICSPALEQEGVPMLAPCLPLVPVTKGSTAPPTTITIGTQAFLVADGGGVLTCGSDYQSATASFQVVDAGADAASVTVACPASLVLASAVPNAEYNVGVSLVGAGDAAVGQTTCSVVAQQGANAWAGCSPVERTGSE